MRAFLQVVSSCGFVMLLIVATVMAVEPAYSGFSAPTGIAVAPDGSLFVSNWGGGTVERIAPDGTRHVVASGIQSPAGVALDAQGDLYVAAYSGDYVMRVSANGGQTRVAEGFATPTGIVFSADGRLLVTNRASGEIIAVDPKTGRKQSIANGLSLPVGVVEMRDRSLVVSQYGGRVTRILPDGTKLELGGSFSRPGVGIIADSSDAIMVIDNGADVVRRVTYDGKSEVVVDHLAGSAVALGRAEDGSLLVGTWGAGHLYRIPR